MRPGEGHRPRLACASGPAVPPPSSPKPRPHHVTPLHALEAARGSSLGGEAPSCGPLRAAARVTALSPPPVLHPQLGHPAPHASSGLCRGLSHLGDPVRLLPLRGTLLPQSAAELPPGLCHPPPSLRPAQPARGWQPAPPCPAGPPQGTPLACVLCEAFVTAFDLRLSSQLEHKSQEGQDRCPDQHLVGTEYILVKSKHKKQRA